MIKEFHLPDVGEGISEAEIVKWLVAEGAWVKEDRESQLSPSPQTADSGTVVGSLSDEEAVEIPAPVKATPAVRALAKKLNVDLAIIRGTGPEGRITREDVEQAVAKKP